MSNFAWLVERVQWSLLSKGDQSLKTGVSVSARLNSREMETDYNSDQWKFMEEMCILVDSQDNQVGSESKKTCSSGEVAFSLGHLRNKETGETLCHRAFSVFLFNSEGRLLIQRRSGDKITFPLFWANTCCSHPLNVEGETDTVNHLGVKR